MYISATMMSTSICTIFIIFIITATVSSRSIRQKIQVAKMRFATPEDEEIGAGCYLRVVEGECDANSELKTNIHVAKDILKPLCFIWRCPTSLEKVYGMLIQQCVARTKLHSTFHYIKNGCKNDDLVFGEAQTPEYSYSLTGARATMPIPRFADNKDAIIECTLQFCPICECGSLTPPRSCSDYVKDVYPPHRNYDIMRYSAAERTECQTTLAPLLNTTDNVTSMARPSHIKAYSSAWTISTIFAFGVIFVISIAT